MYHIYNYEDHNKIATHQPTPNLRSGKLSMTVHLVYAPPLSPSFLSLHPIQLSLA